MHLALEENSLKYHKKFKICKKSFNCNFQVVLNNLIDFRLFCKPEDEQSIPSEGVIQARERGLRSSSETSVFDFRESDSDGETASERQSLHEMRKDRDRRLQEKHQNIPASSLDPSSDLVEVLRVINCCLSFHLSLETFVEEDS